MAKRKHGLKIVVFSTMMMSLPTYEMRSGNGSTIMKSSPFRSNTACRRAAKKLANELGLFCYEAVGYEARNSSKLTRI